MSVSFFFAMAWKSALVAGLALGLAQLLRSRDAAERAALLRVAICLLLLLPIGAALMPAIPLEMAAAARAVPPLLLGDTSAASAPATAPTIWDDPSELVLLLYLGGLAMVAGRLATGLWTLRRWTAEAEPVLSSEWCRALDRVCDTPSGVRLLVSAQAPSPLSWGLRRPVILIDRDSYALPEDADAILAHEVAHVARGDWLTLVLARAAVALFWFNPLVWMIERTVMEDAEQAADREAIGRVEPARYAQILLNFAALGRGNPLPANSITSGSLARRINAILSGDLSRTRRMSGLTLAAIGASVAVAAPVGALQLVAPEAEPAPAAAPALLIASTIARQAAARAQPAAAPLPSAAPAASAVVAIASNAAAGTHALAVPVPPAPPAPPAAPLSALTPSTSPAPPVPPAPPAPPAALVTLASSGWVVDQNAIESQLRQAGRLAEWASAYAERQARIAEKMVAKTARVRAQAVHQRALAMAEGARGLESGAVQMEQGARHMAEQAHKLRDGTYRAQQIAEAARRGETLTDEQLLDTAEELDDGSRDLIDSARDMREQAEEMRTACTET